MKQPEDSGFFLQLSDGRTLVLTRGACLTESDLRGLKSKSPGGHVAAVNPNPTDPDILGLQNLSQTLWQVRLASGDTVEIKPGKTARLAKGVRIRFGTIEGLVVERTALPAVGRSRAVMRAGLVGVGIATLALGAWGLQHRYSSEVAHNEQHEKVKKAEDKNTKLQAADDHAIEDIRISNDETLRSIYDLQNYITFDCLDGVIVDPISGEVSLFGHQASPDRLLSIPYFDYLATALDCNAPTFSLKWTPESYPEVDRVQKIGEKMILDTVTTFWDKTNKLSAPGAWFLQQYGVSAVPGMSPSIALAWMLEASDRPEASRVVGRLDAWLDAEGDALPAATHSLYEALGVDTAYQEMQRSLAQPQSGNAAAEQLMDTFYMKFFAALDKALESKGNAYAGRYQQSRNSGKSVTQAFHDAQSDLHSSVQGLLNNTLQELSGKNPEIQIPLSIVTRVTGGVAPRMRPVFNDLPPRSLLGRIALLADVSAKQVLNAPWLKKKIPNYRTEFEYDRAEGDSSDINIRWERCEISPGKFEVIQSHDGNAMRFGSTPMMFKTRKVQMGSSNSRTDVSDPVTEKYGAELSSQYDAIAYEIPVLHELREAAKVIAVARWLEERGDHIQLPSEGRHEWTPPEELTGVIHFVLAIKGLKAVVNSSATGGVNLTSGKILTRGAVVPSKNQSIVPVNANGQSIEQNLRDLLSKATSPEQKAALEVKLSHLLGAKGDIQGSSDAWKRAIEHNPDAAKQAELKWQEVKRDLDMVSFFPGREKSNPDTVITGESSVPLTPFDQWGAPHIDEELPGIENLKKDFDTRNPFGPFKYRSLSRPPTASPKLMKFFDKNPTIMEEMDKKYPELKEIHLKRQELQTQLNKPETTPEMLVNIEKEREKLDQNASTILQKIEKEVKVDHPEIEAL